MEHHTWEAVSTSLWYDSKCINIKEAKRKCHFDNFEHYRYLKRAIEKKVQRDTEEQGFVMNYPTLSKYVLVSLKQISLLLFVFL